MVEGVIGGDDGGVGAAEAESRELWFEGVASPETRDGMETNGWTVKEKAQLLIGAT